MSIEFIVTDNHARAFDALEDAALNPPRRAMEQVANAARFRIFYTQTSPDGARWLPSKTAQLESRLTLIDTGALLNEASSDPIPYGIRFGVFNQNIRQYAEIHEEGQRGHPIRSFTGLDATGLEIMTDVIGAHFRNAIRAIG